MRKSFSLSVHSICIRLYQIVSFVSFLGKHVAFFQVPAGETGSECCKVLAPAELLIQKRMKHLGTSSLSRSTACSKRRGTPWRFTLICIWGVYLFKIWLNIYTHIYILYAFLIVSLFAAKFGFPSYLQKAVSSQERWIQKVCSRLVWAGQKPEASHSESPTQYSKDLESISAWRGVCGELACKCFVAGEGKCGAFCVVVLLQFLQGGYEISILLGQGSERNSRSHTEGPHGLFVHQFATLPALAWINRSTKTKSLAGRAMHADPLEWAEMAQEQALPGGKCSKVT